MVSPKCPDQSFLIGVLEHRERSGEMQTFKLTHKESILHEISAKREEEGEGGGGGGEKHDQ